PPYIRAARTRGAPPPPPQLDAPDRAVYQTIYANSAMTGSVAAPTAGLHFTPQLLAALQTAGISRYPVTLHVGLGTFKPVQAELVEQHPMLDEWCTSPHAPAAARTAPSA
ncbi:MAG: S-adenosylmethionine:tRNA ribosyltransferase-isomerase, partial [bacterium]